MSYQVFLTDDAAYDLEALYDYIESHNIREKADFVLDKIEEAFLSLADNPERGTYPNELLAVGLREYREIYFKAYRIIYRISSSSIYVMVIADGRRDMQSLLERRLFQA
ncbi:type II toxin-antitoxin system RelE/ParE family toxin [Marinomonas primoryensis]|uniref:Type II toxin-antitoxin system RelE/ParE family toxin n=1 Tax=Marinomonas primoryensis TaxID=178399 RepID=A0A859CXG2_9GAMM|nr:type II toxin-antitoxin system RelE/ParE family toxin [Marinomonas primoryensis]QKK81365.1 type II toxin-antitoxin system RelE/ParE family toxin [Marinomonas primoryensis]|tara:strand:+ start:579 stop:905 length:327 start_codon:yes stop_codon:yes gene_type:complete